ncbi:MAG: DUF3999 family protein [Pseudomonadota bacterium]
MRKLICLLSFILASPSMASDAIEDYAFKTTLSPSPEALQRVQIPVELILDLTRKDLGDIALFGEDGNALPYTLMRTPDESIDKSVALPVHEFNRFLQQHTKTVTKREQNQQQGQLSELQTTETIAVQQQRKEYLVELKPDEETPDFDYLVLDWLQEPADQLFEVKVESGRELDQLRTIQPGKKLTLLESEDIALRSIRGIPREQKYLRLSPLDNNINFELKSIKGFYRESSSTPTLKHRLSTKRLEDDGQIYYAFEIPSRVLPESISIIPATANSIINGNLLGSRDHFKTQKRFRYGFNQHNITNADIKPSQPIAMKNRNFYHYRIQANEVLPAAPDVLLHYPPYEIIFLGSTNTSATLAWGNYESQGKRSGLENFLQQSRDETYRKASLVGTGQTEEAGGRERLGAEFGPPWKKWLLWAFLLLAAALTGRMAFKLYREMNLKETSDAA